MKYLDLKGYIQSDRSDSSFLKIYSQEELSFQKERYLNLLEKSFKTYGDGDYIFVSSPGRAEIGGNHTDHQHGTVLACALNIDNVACAKKSDKINYIDNNFEINNLDPFDSDFHEDEKYTSNGLIRGIIAKLYSSGYFTGGFSVCADSKVLVGSGISSSACFEVMIVEIINSLYNRDIINETDRAIISQYSENNYFGKPCGLMDQMAISQGGFVSIDFNNPLKPLIDKIEFSFLDKGYKLVLVNTKGNHSDLSNEYASIPAEMKLVSNQLSANYLRETNQNNFYNNLKNIRNNIKNDRALLRAIHFYNENQRALDEAVALKDDDFNKFLKLVKESGQSSFMYLQNIYSNNNPNSQSLSLALAISNMILKDEGAYRVHGGGFEGTIEAIVPVSLLDEYTKYMESIFGRDCLLSLEVRKKGCVRVI